MSIFRNRTALKAAKKMKAFLTPGTGLVMRATMDKRARQQITSQGREIVALRRALTKARSAVRLLDPSGESTPVFFVVGYQKSGTTWLMKMLDSHPEILCQGEGRPFGRNWRQEHLKQRRTSLPPTSLYGAIAGSEDLRYWMKRSVWTKRGDADEHLNNLARLAIEYSLTQELLKSGKKLVGDKTVLLSPEIIEEIGKVFPDTKVIHIIRDGRDVVVSQTHHAWNQAEDRGGTSKIGPERLAKREAYRKDPQALVETGGGIFPDGELRNAAAKWSTRVSRTVRDGPALLGANYAEVKYEDLLEKPEEEVERLLGFLGADKGEQAVKQCVGAASFERLSGGRNRGREAASFFRKGIAGDWKNVFTEQNKRDFKAAAGDFLIELGYEKDDAW